MYLPSLVGTQCICTYDRVELGKETHTFESTEPGVYFVSIVKYAYLPRKYYEKSIFEIDANLFNLLIDFMFAILSSS